MESAATREIWNPGSSERGATPWDHLLSEAHRSLGQTLKSSLLRGRRVLVTGAGGSIGSALAHATAASLPASLILLDSSENGLYQVDRGLREGGFEHHTPLLASVCNLSALDHALGLHRPEIVFHAAALKHVPMMEQNPFAAVETNVFGTRSLLEAAAAHGVEKIVLVSTDKAVDPCSIMGASKRIAEQLFLRGETATSRIVVRLCNVLGSQGSVLPLFLEQIAKGGPVTVTHPDAQRYFITIVEAVNALLASLAEEACGATFLPDVGPPRRILDLARHLIDAQQSSAAIECSGLRPGDKLVEQLISSRESYSRETTNRGSGLRSISTQPISTAELSASLQTLREALDRHDLNLLLHGLQSIVPEYQPSSVISERLRKEPACELAAEMQV